MKTVTKAEVTAAIAATEVAVVVAPVKAKKVRAPKTVEEALGTEIGNVNTNKEVIVARPAKKVDGFKRGGKGVFTCKGCGTSTRETSETADLELCPTCYEIAGYENVMADNAPDSEEYKFAESAIAALSAMPEEAFVGPLPRKLEGAIKHTTGVEVYTMPAAPALRAGTRKAAVWEAMAAACPGTRAELIAAAEAAEQAWRSSTKRLEAAKPGAKWFRRFAPVVA